ncbi:MAG: methyltransferase domain-containing protein [Alphaproteobacteria bacterium]|nr:methyltransferase domain-containing protein [Alphaproteobacteria bacterium]
MTDSFEQVATHYGTAGTAERILTTLQDEGIDIDALTPEILAPIDQFHTRGILATREHAAMAVPREDMHVLDVGCGIGGPARYLATTYGCRVTGVDLTQEYVSVARMLTERCRLDHFVDFRQANGLDLPFDDASFDLVWCQNVTMNIEDKAGFYREIARVLKPGGRFTSTEMAAGAAGPPHYPQPWARKPEISFLVPQDEMRTLLGAAGFRIVEWRDTSAETISVTQSPTEQARHGKLGIGLIAGADIGERVANSRRSIEEGRLSNVMMVAEK